ncbi:MAG: NAD-dependent deacylase [Deltaproteobacteria bacterium]|nr:NAD-dependent deacylase [Deltaproteobacteria bacterium]
MEQTALAEARRLLAQAASLCVLTGAGISAESGVPTFRGPGGLWENHRPEDLATPGAFRRDPALVWRWYAWRRGLIAACRPNPGHTALVRLEERLPSFTLITQNVDGLHALAGSRRLLELHGNLWRTRCTACGLEAEDRRPELPPLPACPACGGLLRPAVVWFGESLDPTGLDAAWRAAREGAVMLTVGTSAMVEPAASLVRVAREAGARVIQVNLEATAHTPLADYSLLGPAGQVLPRLVEET